MEVRDATYREIKRAILRQGGNKVILNVGLPPQEGKYNESACISCYKHYSLHEAIRRRWRCTCGGKIKKGVKDRVNELADFLFPRHPNHRPPYLHIIPLAEIIAKALNQSNPFTKTVTKRWGELVDIFGNEVSTLVDADINSIANNTRVPAITEAIAAFREGRVTIHAGGGGRYGIIELPGLEKHLEKQPEKQRTLLDYA
jgi:uncharacterized protein (TIGR00375 family)